MSPRPGAPCLLQIKVKAQARALTQAGGLAQTRNFLRLIRLRPTRLVRQLKSVHSSAWVNLVCARTPKCHTHGAPTSFLTGEPNSSARRAPRRSSFLVYTKAKCLVITVDKVRMPRARSHILHGLAGHAVPSVTGHYMQA